MSEVSTDDEGVKIGGGIPKPYHKQENGSDGDLENSDTSHLKQKKMTTKPNWRSNFPGGALRLSRDPSVRSLGTF